jgi:hippurate hydrolase
VPQDKLPTVTRSKTETTPPTINDKATAETIRAAFASHFGEGRLIQLPPEGMGAEDFAYFVTPESGVKGVYFNVGGTPAEQVGKVAGHHSPLFKVEPEPSILTGTEAMVVGAMTLMPKG